MVEACFGAVQMPLQGRFEGGAVVGVHAAQPGRHVVRELVRLEAEHALPARRQVHRAGREIPLPQPVLAAAQRQLIALFGRAQVGFGAGPPRLAAHQRRALLGAALFEFRHPGGQRALRLAGCVGWRRQLRRHGVDPGRPAAGQRQIERHPRALAGFAVHLQLRAMQFDDASRNRQDLVDRRHGTGAAALNGKAHHADAQGRGDERGAGQTMSMAARSRISGARSRLRSDRPLPSRARAGSCAACRRSRLAGAPERPRA